MGPCGSKGSTLMAMSFPILLMRGSDRSPASSPVLASGLAHCDLDFRASSAWSGRKVCVAPPVVRFCAPRRWLLARLVEGLRVLACNCVSGELASRSRKDDALLTLGSCLRPIFPLALLLLLLLPRLFAVRSEGDAGDPLR